MAYLKLENRARSILDSGVNDSDTSWTLDSGDGALFPATGDFHVTCEDEIVKCTSRAGDVLTVVRSQEGTSNVAHIAGKAVELRITKAILTAIEAEIDTKIANVVEDTTPQLGGDLNCMSKKLSAITGVQFANFSETTINAGQISIAATYHSVDTQNDDATDDLDTILNGANFNFLVLRAANDARTVVIKHNTGNIWLQGQLDISLDDLEDGLLLIWDGTKWFDIGGGVPADYIDKTHLSQDFGASATRLRNLILVPKANQALYIATAGASIFAGDIDDNAGAHGGQGLDATHVPYDGDSNENMMKGIGVGASFVGRIILHNTTRSNTRKIVDIDVTDNVILTESSSDDWADDDVITCQSTTNASAGYFDLDISAQLASTDVGAVFVTSIGDNEAADVFRRLILHPYETYDSGKRSFTYTSLANQDAGQQVFMPVISQKITVKFDGYTDQAIQLLISGTLEYADT